MRPATQFDRSSLKELYNQSLAHAENVGFIDWPNPFLMKNIDELIDSNELFCFDEENGLGGAAKVSRNPDIRIWTDQQDSTIYLGKVATGDAVRGKGYFSKVMLPRIQEYENPVAIRLDCLSDNVRLRAFYEGLGFKALDEVVFFSEKQKKDISVATYQLI